MTRPVTKVVYKPDSQSTEEFTVIVNPDEYKKWKSGDTSIPLTEVVDSFKVFSSTQGAQGLLGLASNQQLDNVFGTHKDVDVITKILKEGRQQTSGPLQKEGLPTTLNVSHGSDNYYPQ